jgi:hypothetical protein
MKDKHKNWIANLLLLVACIYLYTQTKDLRGLIIMYVIVAFTMNGFYISKQLFKHQDNYGND